MFIITPSNLHDSALFKRAYWQSVRANIDQLVKYQITIGLLGKAGTGKSTLCQALLGCDIEQLPYIEPNTSYPEEFTLAYKHGKGVALIDMPGFGGKRSDQDIQTIYESLLPAMDLVLWVVKANDPELQIDIDFYQHTLATYTKQCTIPVLLVVNDFQLLQAAEETQAPVQMRFGQVQECAVSAQTGAGVYQLLEQVLANLPQQRFRKKAG